MPSTQNNYVEAIQETIEKRMEKITANERRKRINRYKKIIIYTLVVVIFISILLWIAILLKINQIDQSIDMIGRTIVDNIWRT